MNLGNTGFAVYWIALIVSGILMLTIAGTGFGDGSAGRRVLNTLFGLGFLGYGLYLGFVFKGGHYRLFFYAFAVPVIVVINAVRAASAKKTANVRWAPADTQTPVHMPAPGQGPFPAPGQAPVPAPVQAPFPASGPAPDETTAR